MTQQHGSTGGQQQFTQQPGGQQDAGTLPQKYRRALDVVAQSVAVCGWCADQCVTSADPHMIECIRRCEDVVEIGETLLAVAPRSSRYTADIARTFAQAAQACARECGQHQDSHCQECASLLPQAAQSAQQLTMGGGQGPRSQQGGPRFQQGQQGQQGGAQFQGY